MKNRKIWFTYDIEPSENLTGGIWYRDNEFDSDLIDALYSKVLQFISFQGFANKQEIVISLRNSVVGTENNLKEKHVNSIIDLLINDDKIELVSNRFSNNPTFRISNWDKIIEEPVLTQIPCGVCPVFKDCNIGGKISPENCIHFNDW